MAEIEKKALDHVYGAVSDMLDGDYTRDELYFALSRLLDDVAKFRTASKD